MKTYTVKLKSLSPYSQSKHYNVPKTDKELPDAYERRTWANRLHVDESGYVFIPPMAIKNCLSEAAKFLGIQVAGKGKSTYTKHFEAGVMVVTPIPIHIKASDVKSEELFVPSSGIRGDGKRVIKLFPCIPVWEGEVEIHVLDETITKEILRQHLEEAGKLIGIGRFRPRNNGFYGRFKIEDLREVTV